MWSKGLWLKIILYIEIIFMTFGDITFYNINCTCHDKAIGDFEFCYIKAINRSLKYASAKFNIRQSVTQASIRWTLFKRANGWKPFLYNFSFDACKFLKGAIKTPVVNYMFNTVKPYTNLNHTCPYNNDISVINLPTTAVDNNWSKALPMPTGEYCLHTNIFIKQPVIVEVRFYMRLS